MFYAIDEATGEWRAPADAEDTAQLYRFRIERAKSGRAKCKNCGETVKAGNWRVGTPIKWRGIISSWNHPECFYCKEDPITCNFDRQVYGWDLLQGDEEEIEKMKRELGKSVPPEHLGGEIKPGELENDEFLAKQQQHRKTMQRLPAPENMVLSLLPFQEEGHFWMLEQEKLEHCPGGILADEMGLGKTIQTIAMLASSKLQQRKGEVAGPTLIVTPASALLQWQDEINRSTLPNTFSILVYNSGRTSKWFTPKDLLSYDIVLTSYPVLEQEYRQAINAQKVDCEYCGRKFLQRKLGSHLKYFCGPDAVKTARQEKQERKREEGTKKAMKTLHIGTTSTTTPAQRARSSAITPTAIYRELMEDAGRTPSSMMATAAAARAADERMLEEEEEEEEPRPVKRKPRVIDLEDDSEEEIVPKKRTAADRANADQVVVLESESEGAKKPMGHELWYCADLGLFWQLDAKRWRGATGVRATTADWLLVTQSREAIELQREGGTDRIRLSTHAMETSKDGGKTWKQVPSGLESSPPSFWIGRERGVSTTGAPHEFLGRVVARRFGRRDVLGVIIGEEEDEEGILYRVQHCDGDAEDLDEDEAKAAIQRCCAEKLSLAWLLKSKPAPAVAAAAAATSAKKKKKKHVEEDDDVFIVEEDEEEDDEEDEDVEVEEEEEEDDLVARPLPRFVPQTWGREDAYEGFLSALPAPKPKRKRKTPAKQRKKTALDSEDEEEEEKETEENDAAAEPKARPLYAPFGYIVDEDGLDLNRSLLHCIAWSRIIIDEAHKIKERTNSTAKSVFALRGELTPSDAKLDPGCTAFENYCRAQASTSKSKKDLTSSWKALGQRERDAFASNGDSVLLDKCRRWALTGTPLMNRLGDLYSLVRFLRVPPYSYYYCKRDCDCRLLQWSFGWDAKYCQHCGHTPMSHYSYFNKHIMNPVTRSGFVGQGKRAMELLRDDLLGEIMLRRTKAERVEDLNLPPLTITTVDIELSESQRDFYESIYKLSKAKFNTFVAKGTVLNNYAHVFQLLSRLRQAADHPYLILGPDAVNATVADVCAICMMNVDDAASLAIAKCRHTFHRECVEQYIDNFDSSGGEKNGTGKKRKRGGNTKTEDDGEEGEPAPLATCPSCFVPLTLTLRVHQDGEEPGAEAAAASVDSNVCVICMDRPRNALLLPCGHVHMCHECAHGLENKTCPVCRERIEKIVKAGGGGAGPATTTTTTTTTRLFGRKSILQGLKLEEFQSSSKLDAIVREVSNAVSNSADAQKIIVFSQFTTFLDLIQWRLQTLHITGVVKFVGSLNSQERRAVLNEFKTNPEVNVILMSLKAGGEGLNLQEASVVLSVDPWWNPSVEMQAFHRAHRIGQTRSVRAVRFVTSGTIEERMMQLQDKKRLIFEACVDGNDASLARLTQEDLQFLFSN